MPLRGGIGAALFGTFHAAQAYGIPLGLALSSFDRLLLLRTGYMACLLGDSLRELPPL